MDASAIGSSQLRAAIPVPSFETFEFNQVAIYRQQFPREFLKSLVPFDAAKTLLEDLGTSSCCYCCSSNVLGDQPRSRSASYDDITEPPKSNPICLNIAAAMITPCLIPCTALHFCRFRKQILQNAAELRFGQLFLTDDSIIHIHNIRGRLVKKIVLLEDIKLIIEAEAIAPIKMCERPSLLGIEIFAYNTTIELGPESILMNFTKGNMSLDTANSTPTSIDGFETSKSNMQKETKPCCFNISRSNKIREDPSVLETSICLLEPSLSIFGLKPRDHIRFITRLIDMLSASSESWGVKVVVGSPVTEIRGVNSYRTCLGHYHGFGFKELVLTQSGRTITVSAAIKMTSGPHGTSDESRNLFSFLRPLPEVGDVLLEFNGKSVAGMTVAQVQAAMERTEAGRYYPFKFKKLRKPNS